MSALQVTMRRKPESGSCPDSIFGTGCSTEGTPARFEHQVFSLFRECRSGGWNHAAAFPIGPRRHRSRGSSWRPQKDEGRSGGLIAAAQFRYCSGTSGTNRIDVCGNGLLQSLMGREWLFRVVVVVLGLLPVALIAFALSLRDHFIDIAQLAPRRRALPPYCQGGASNDPPSALALSIAGIGIDRACPRGDRINDVVRPPQLPALACFRAQWPGLNSRWLDLKSSLWN
ncbi:hypothetical protein ABIB07_001218 [Bradyrhizobium sp. RT10b]